MVNFDKLNIERKLERKTVEFNGKEIQILQYLPVSEKEDIIAATLQKSLTEDGIYSPLLLDAHFHLNIIYCYTDIMISAAEKVDELDLYDRMRVSGLMDLILKSMDPDEYNELQAYLVETLEKVEKYSNTVVGFLRNAMMNLPENAQKAVDILQNLDPAQFKELANIAKTLNVDIPGLDKMKS